MKVELVAGNVALIGEVFTFGGCYYLRINPCGGAHRLESIDDNAIYAVEINGEAGLGQIFHFDNRNNCRSLGYLKFSDDC